MDQGDRSVDYDKLKQALLAALEPLKDLRLDPSRVNTGRKIGSGGFGDVFHATLKTRGKWYTSSKTPVVVKKLRAEGDADQRLRVVVALARELVVWSRFNHPNVLGLLGYYFDKIGFTYACAVTELQENGNIMDYVRRMNLGGVRRLELVYDVASGLAYLHSLEPPVCHGDIKPENTLVNHLEKAVICDFGLAKTLKDDPSGLTTTSQSFTPRYASPEVLQDASIRTLPSDVWSWGCLFYQLVSGRSPYSDMPLGAIYAAATSGQPPATLDGLPYPSDLKTLLRSCWAFVAESRPSMRKCKRTVSWLEPHWEGSDGIPLSEDIPQPPEPTLVLPDSLTRSLKSLAHLRMDMSKVDIPPEAPISFGGHGEVRCGRVSSLNGESILVAVKTLRCSSMKNERVIHVKLLVLELNVWSRIHHPHILPFIGFHLSDDLQTAYLLSPWAAEGDLPHWLAGRQPDQKQRLDVAKDTATGLAYLHSQDPSVCHGDIKAENVLISEDSRGVLSDFGLSRIQEQLAAGATPSNRPNGTPRYMSPELADGTSSRCREGDVWAWGCLLYYIMTEQVPHKDAKFAAAVYAAIYQKEMPGNLEAFDASLRPILERCWDLSPEKRPTMKTCCEMLCSIPPFAT